MSRKFVAASNEYLYTDTPPLTGYPLTVSCWFYPETAHTGAMFSIADTAAALNYFLGYISAAGFIYYFIRDGSGLEQLGGAGGNYTAQTWNFFAAVSTVDDHWRYWNDEVLTEPTNKTPVGIDRYTIGARSTSADDFYFNGNVAELGVWNAALSASRIGVLRQGYSPTAVQPENLVSYRRFIRDDDKDLISGLSLSANGTPEIADHPRVIYPGVPQILSLPVGILSSVFGPKIQVI